LDLPPANTDINFRVLFEPQRGQASFFSSAAEKIKASKTFLHFLHLNS